LLANDRQYGFRLKRRSGRSLPAQKEEVEKKGGIRERISVTQRWPTNLVIIRHGESVQNVAEAAAKANRQADSYAVGFRNMDTELTELGGRQADVTGE
jgi:hypothetical protein